MPHRPNIHDEQLTSAEEEVREALVSALRVLSWWQDPHAVHLYRSLNCRWPGFTHEWDGYGWSESKVMPLPPTTEEISQLDQTLAALHESTSDNRDRRVVFNRAKGFGWRKICHKDGRNKDILMSLYVKSLKYMVKILGF